MSDRVNKPETGFKTQEEIKVKISNDSAEPGDAELQNSQDESHGSADTSGALGDKSGEKCSENSVSEDSVNQSSNDSISNDPASSDAQSNNEKESSSNAARRIDSGPQAFSGAVNCGLILASECSS